MRYLVPIGRLLFAAIFILGSLGHFSAKDVAYAAAQEVPMANVLVPLSGVMALLGGVSILLGFQTKIGAWLIIAFLVPVTLMMHNFWAVKDPAMAQIQQIMFLKNTSMLGGAIIIAYFGAGPCSVDEALCGKALPKQAAVEEVKQQ